MRFQPELPTYSQYPQRKKKEQKERNDYDYSFNLLNQEGTIQELLKGDILTSYEHSFFRAKVVLPHEASHSTIRLMPNLLAVETSSPVLSVAVKKRHAEVMDAASEGFLKHGENLIPMIDQLLKKQKMKLEDIQYFLIGRGPGSFTGLRMGFATFKGLLLPEKKPCYGALSLDIIANAVDLPDGSWLAVCLDAFRQKIYTRIYRKHSGEWQARSKPKALSLDEWARKMNREIYVTGDAIRRYENEMRSRLEAAEFSGKVHFLPEKNWYPKASALIRLFENRKKNRAAAGRIKKLKTPGDFVPLYLRKTEAEEKRKAHASAC